MRTAGVHFVTITGMKHLRGKFIVLDGGEGCGKSTQAALVGAALEKAGVPTVLVRDPGSTRIGELVRGILLDPSHSEMSMRCEMLLYMAARAQMMKQIILPALAEKKCVISDRFVSSTLAYQLGGDGLSSADIRKVGDVAVSGHWPDLTIILGISVEKSADRLMGSTKQRSQQASSSLFADRIEQRPDEYHQRVYENYLAQAKEDPKHVRVVDADRDREAVLADILELLKSLK